MQTFRKVQVDDLMKAEAKKLTACADKKVRQVGRKKQPSERERSVPCWAGGGQRVESWVEVTLILSPTRHKRFHGYSMDCVYWDTR